jgi:hypothetical protein
MGLAADCGVTICFADLDGADGLWVPEERTILVNRRLPEERVNEVIEHELAHVAIDDQHAELDAGVWQRAPRPLEGPLHGLLAKRWATPVLSAAAFVALVGGVTAGLTAAMPDGPHREITNPTLPAPSESGQNPGEPTTSLSPAVDENGRTYNKTVHLTLPPSGSPTLTASGSRPAASVQPPRRSGGATSSVKVAGTTPAPPTVTTPPPTQTPTVDPTTPGASPTSPAAASVSAGAGPSG